MCDDPMHDPEPVGKIVSETPGLNSTELFAELYANGVTNQQVRIALAVHAGLIHKRRKGKATLHFPGRRNAA